MLAFENILQRIESEISQLQFTNPPKSLYEPIEYILSLGGKRIRPALTLMACNIYNNSIENAIKPALGLEVFHNFTLLHDDLMDEADKRRNKPTVHKVWNANTAILSGDAMLIAAYQLIGSTEHGHLKQVLDLFTQTAAEICGGQQFDMEFESRGHRRRRSRPSAGAELPRLARGRHERGRIHRDDPAKDSRTTGLLP